MMIIAVLIFSSLAPSPTPLLGVEEYQISLSSDFPARDKMKQTTIAEKDWFHPIYGKWGPFAVTFPVPKIPDCVDCIEWKRDRIIEVAKHHIGLPYERDDGQRGHFPARGCGLDCSNFAAWVYNYGLGIRFTSNVHDLWASKTAGRKLAPHEKLERGDLVFLEWGTMHVVIYIDENQIIDSTNIYKNKNGIYIRDIRKSQHHWYHPDLDNPYYLGARRFIE